MDRTPEQEALDNLCAMSGYERWWIKDGHLYFERDAESGWITVMLCSRCVADAPMGPPDPRIGMAAR